MSVSDSCDLRIYRGWEGLQAIEPIWAGLSAKMHPKRFWHTYEWYESYLQNLEPEPDAVSFVVARRGDDVVAILPFRKRPLKRLGITLECLELIRHSHIKLKDIIFPECYRRSDIIRELMTGLRKNKQVEWDCLAMSGVLPDSGALALVEAAPGGKWIETLDTCDYLELPSSYETFLEKVSKNLRRNLRAANKRASVTGGISSRIVRTSPELDHALDIFLKIESSGWKGAGGTRSAIRLNQKLVDFYRHLVARFGEEGNCEISLLYLNRRPIAGALGLIAEDTLYLLKIAYDQDHAAMSPGLLHMEKILQHHIAKNEVKYVNLMSGSASPWHHRWRPSQQTTYRLLVFNRRPMSLGFFLLKKGRRLLGATLEKVN